MKKGQYHYFSSTYQLMKPSIPRIVKLRSLEPGFVGVGGRHLMMVDPSSDAVLLELVQEMHSTHQLGGVLLRSMPAQLGVCCCPRHQIIRWHSRCS
eukprot:scaffold33524_cov99-Skeletonema_dohrnii-CCMP3373.AAC.3